MFIMNYRLSLNHASPFVSDKTTQIVSSVSSCFFNGRVDLLCDRWGVLRFYLFAAVMVRGAF